MVNKILLPLAIGGAVRYYLLYFTTTYYTSTATSQYVYNAAIGDRVEISTPLNSFKRLQEGIYLYENGIDPYQGDMVHELPLVLLMLAQVFKYAIRLVPLFFVVADLLTALMLYKLSQQFVRTKLQQQKIEHESYAADTEELQIQKTDIETIPRSVLYAYLFNPLSVLNCVGLTTTVFSNLFLTLALFFFMKRQLHAGLLFLGLETLRNLYPVVLLGPVVLMFYRPRRTVAYAMSVIMLFGVICATLAWINFHIMGSWSFIDGTLGFIFFYRDLQPNIGLFWYFFTEMFDHFRTMFLITFQMNATVLYLLPLSFKLRKEPLLLATVLIALMSTFRSYPCLGDVGLYLALLPLWRRCWKFMAHNFVVFGFFIVTLCMLPALWHLWIYAGSANANFYFGTTLAFCTGQIFLITDLLFAHVKREFCLRNGQKIFINGKEAKIVLE